MSQTYGTLSVESLHEDAPRDGRDMHLLRRLLPFARPHLTLFGAALLLMPLTAAASVVQPYLLKRAVDAAVVLRSEAGVFEVTVLYAVALAVEFATRFAQTYTMQLAGQRAMADLRRRVFEHLQRLGLSYFDRTPTGRLVTRLTNDIDSLGEVFASGAVTALADVLLLVGIVGVMLALDWRMSLVAFAALPPLALVIGMFRRYAREAFRVIRARIAELNAFLAEQVNGIATVQSFGREARCAKEYDRINAAHRDANRASIKYDALLYSVVESVAAASVAIILWFAAQRAGVVASEGGAAVYVGTVVAFYEYIQRFFVPIRDLSTKYTIIQSSLAAAERVFGLLDHHEADAPESADVEAAPGVPAPGGEALGVEGLSFAYRRGVDVLSDVGFRVGVGETVAVVGATGSGKTTLASLFVRLYEPTRGEVRVFGRDVRQWPRRALRRTFAVVPQDVFLFAGSVLDNICAGEPVPDRERAERVLADLGVREFLERRGRGLDARVDERGQNLSAGERQIVALARALYREAQILVLDEATANIDSETESVLTGATRRFAERRTVLVIAHRLSTIRSASRILVLHHGRLVEEGAHDSLLAADGVYARLYALHYAAQRATTPPPPPGEAFPEAPGGV